MHIVVSLACRADSSTVSGWTEWVEKGDQFPYIHFLFQSPKAIRGVIQSCLWFKTGWGEKAVEKSADSLHGQWVRYCLKVGSLGSVSGLCLVLCPCAAHTKFCVCCPVCEMR